MLPPSRLPLVLLSLVFALVAPAAASAAPGDLDPSFGSGGMVKLLPSEEESYAEAVAVQPDGKIVVAGYEKGNAVVLRLLPNGEPDTGFGGGGKVTTVIPTGFSGFRAVTLQPDGRIVAVGEAKGATTGDFLIARYNADGSPDGSFGGGDGIELVPVGALGDQAEAVAIGPEGKIAVTGYAGLPGPNEALAVVVLKANGEPDASFGGDGSVTKETAATYDTGVAIAMFGDGGILVADNNGAGGGDGFVLMKLLADGKYDPGFGGGDGTVVTELPVDGAEGVSAGRVNDLAVQPDGRIVAAGYGFDYQATPSAYLSEVVVTRYTPEGELDASFASGGIFTHRIENEGTAETMELGEKGRILIAGYYENPTSKMSSSWVGRLDANGSLDPGFGAGGLVLRGDTAPFGEGVEASAIDSEDRLLTVGTAYGGGGTSWGSLTRYLGDPRPAAAAPISAPGRANRPAHAKMKTVPKKLRVGNLKGFSGTAADPDGNAVQRVQLALVQKVRGGAKAKASARGRVRCFALKNAKLRFKRVKAKGKQCPQVWLTAEGTSKWRFKLKGTLPPGRYVVYARATDGQGLAETSFSRKLGNRYAFRVLPPRQVRKGQLETKSSRIR
jgi:uncharacterized delta-60 repeat protein